MHDRMPVVIEDTHLDEWLDAKTSESGLGWLLWPAPNDWLVEERLASA